jgi:hypothetical protein
VAAGLFVVVAVMYVQDRNNKSDEPPTPASIPGHAQLKNVVDALRGQDITTDYAKTGGAKADGLTPPGQGLTADGHPLYVFIYDDVATRESEVDSLGGEVILTSPSGNPLDAEAIHSVAGSNVFAVLTGGDDALIEKVDNAITGIP